MPAVSLQSVHRVHIVGGAGAGKSTLACRLAAALPAPAYHLDALNISDTTEHSPAVGDRAAAVARIAAEPSWVSEGIFLGWTDALLQAADRIVWLDIPWYLALYRIVRRYIAANRSGSNPYRGLRRLLRFLGWSVAYYRPLTPAQIDALPEENLHSRAATARHLGPYRQKVVRCSSAADLARLPVRLGLPRGGQAVQPRSAR